MSPLGAEVALRVLVVEDDDDARENLRDILELDQHTVTTAASAAEAFAQADWANTDVVVLDRRLPDATADELLPRLREAAPRAAIVVVTGFADVESAIGALRRGAFDYLLKPVAPDALRTVLHRVGLQRRSALELDQREQQQGVVAELGRLALATPNVESLRRAACAATSATLQCDGCSVWELSSDGVALKLGHAHGWPESAPDGAPLHAESVWSATLRSRQPVLISDVQAELRPILGEQDWGRRPRGVAAVPLPGERRPLGVLLAVKWAPWLATPAEVTCLQSIANVLGAALSRQLAEERARQAERLAAIGQTVAGLAHESRNALQRSQACLEMLALQVEDRPAALELVARIQRAQDHLHHLYEEVRGYAAPLRLHRRPCDLRQLWRDTWTHLEVARRDKPIELTEQVTTDDLLCSVDPDSLEQVLRNILDNAIDACPNPGAICIAARDAELDGQPALRLSFRDNGPGLGPEQRARVFEPFYTTKTAGTGLGMAIARRICEAHGGRLLVGDAPTGAELLLYLPKGPT